MDSETLKKLVTFKICRCINVAHGRLNFHSCAFPGLAFLPAFITSAKLLTNIWWSHQILDLSKCSFSDEFFETAKNVSPQPFGFSHFGQNIVKESNTNIYEVQRMLLYHQGIFVLIDTS